MVHGMSAGVYFTLALMGCLMTFALGMIAKSAGERHPLLYWCKVGVLAFVNLVLCLYGVTGAVSDGFETAMWVIGTATVIFYLLCLRGYRRSRWAERR